MVLILYRTLLEADNTAIAILCKKCNTCRLQSRIVYIDVIVGGGGGGGCGGAFATDNLALCNKNKLQNFLSNFSLKKMDCCSLINLDYDVCKRIMMTLYSVFNLGQSLEIATCIYVSQRTNIHVLFSRLEIKIRNNLLYKLDVMQSEKISL